MGVYTGTYTSGLELGQSPATLAQGGFVTDSPTGPHGGTAIFGSGSGNFTNHGTVAGAASGASGYGIFFSGGGVVTNDAVVQGKSGLRFMAAGNVDNSGVIAGSIIGVIL